jgi:hypothetical protein
MHRLFVSFFLLLVAHSAVGAPSRIIVLRHGEKENAYALCDVGQQRSLALKSQYLGKHAEKTLFPQAAPAAFFAITLHTLELLAPAADSWGLPVTTFSVVPIKGMSDTATTQWLNRQTQRAAAEVMNDTRWRGQTVVMAWEHKHIANHRLEKNNPDSLIELRELLKLEQLPETDRKSVPKTWSGTNYNFFWIIDYNESGQPVSFKALRQDFTGQFSTVPNNAWGSSEDLPGDSRCK